MSVFTHLSYHSGRGLVEIQMNVGCISTHPSLVHCKFVLIQFPSFLLAQVQPECQFSHMNVSLLPYRRGLVEIPDGTLAVYPLIQVWYTV